MQSSQPLDPSTEEGALRGRGRSVGRVRGRARGSVGGRVTGIRRGSRGGSGASAGIRKDPSSGWRKSRALSAETLVLESVFLREVFSDKARLFGASAVEKLEVELNVRELPDTRAGHVALLMNDVLQKCMVWLNEKVVLERLTMRKISMADMYRFVAVLLYSHCTGFSVTKTIQKLSELGQNPPSLERTQFIQSNILAYSATGRADGCSTWNSQRDQTHRLGEFEKAAFNMSCKVFLTPLYTLATLDDDLYGTRSSDNQVKTLSSRKADKEGHCADALADALFRITFMVRFRRRGEAQSLSVSKLLEDVLYARGEQSVCGFTITADRGYAKMSLVRALNGLGISSMFVMPDHIIRCHPFAARSNFCVGAEAEDESEDESESDGDGSGDNTSCNPRLRQYNTGRNELSQQVEVLNGSDNSDNDENDGGPSGVVAGTEHLGTHPRALIFDRPQSFIVPDEANAGPLVVCATKRVIPSRHSSRSSTCRNTVRAIAVRVQGTKKIARVIRFLYCVPPCIGF
jgi:hypothetical protein